MAEFICDYSLKDIGEIIMILRCRKLKLNEDAFAKMIGVSVPGLREIEEGRSMHAFTIIKKLIDMKQLQAEVKFTL